MEQIYNNSKNTYTDTFSDPSHRMSQRPHVVKSGEGLGFQDLGSSFSPPKARVAHGKPSKGKFKAAVTVPHKPRKAPPRLSEDESDDELLLSSQNSMGSDATSSPKRVSKGKKREIVSDEEETVRVNGRVLKAHPDYKPSSMNAVKGLRFTKSKKNILVGDDTAELPPSSSSPNDSQELFAPLSNDIEILDTPPGGPSSRQGPSVASPTRHTGSNSTHGEARRPADTEIASFSTPPPSTAKNNPQPPAKPRPRPRAVTKPVSRKRDSSPESTPRPAVEKRGFPLRSKTPDRPANPEGKRSVMKPAIPSKSRREPQEFPVSLQAKENISDKAWSGDSSSGKTKKTGIPRSATFVHALRPIPLPSPLRMKPASRVSTFPDLSPLSSQADESNARAKSHIKANIDSADSQRKRGGPKPFPMSPQVLASIDRRSNLGSTKRTSSDDSGTEQGHMAKKWKDSCLEVPDTLDYLSDPMEEDSIDFGDARDPSTLCPYCDEGLPSHPTPYFQHLLSTARKKSVSDPRPRNRCGLKAPLTIYISVCQRHRFESHQLPIATERGWPKTIDFTKVPERVRKMRKELQAIILDSGDISDTNDRDAAGGPRRKSVFWREVKKQVKKQGSRTVLGVKGQFASFEKTQPGYYGEQGSVIIHQTLFDLFPPSTFDPSLITPLTPAEFIQLILVPEAAVRLIIQDLCIDVEDAIVTLRDSAQYGVAMFPDTGENKRQGTGADDDEMTVADQIVMERARVRRRELAEEEKIEREMLDEERAAQRAKARESRREKAAVERTQTKQNKARMEGKVEAEDTSEVFEVSPPHRMRRGTRQRAVADDSESDAMSVDSLASRQSIRIAKKVSRSDGDKVVRATPHLDGSDVELVDKLKREAGVRRSTRKVGAEPDVRVDTKTTTPRERETPFNGSAMLNGDEENESTPRPTRQRTQDTKATQNAVSGLHARMLPLQMARNRPNPSGSNTHDGWSRSLRTSVPDDADSDESIASRRSQRLVRPPIRKRGPDSWLLSDSSAPDST